jgi:hypothetical protein
MSSDRATRAEPSVKPDTLIFELSRDVKPSCDITITAANLGGNQTFKVKRSLQCTILNFAVKLLCYNSVQVREFHMALSIARTLG